MKLLGKPKNPVLLGAAVIASTWGFASSWMVRSHGPSPRKRRTAGAASNMDYRRIWSMAATENEAIYAVGDDNNILEDGAGRINRDLAERIWAWEQERRENENLPKLAYSVRSGLKMVDSTVEDLLLRRKDTNLRSDLIQEGLSALLDAMSNYRHQNDETRDAKSSTSSPDFEAYAREHIRQRLQMYLDQGTDRPLNLPQAVQSVVRRANRLMAQRKGANNIDGYTLASVAEELEIPLPRLRTYLRLARATSHALSMESTVEISHPSTLDESTFRDQDEWELNEGLLLDDGHTVQKDQVIAEYLDEMTEREGDDQAWIQQEQIAGPLPELIPDISAPSPDDDLILQDLIRSDLNNFLTSALDPQEVRAIRLAFGLLDDNSSTAPRTMKETAQELQIPVMQVPKLLARALDKLRASYVARFLDSGEHDDEDYVVDSV